MYGDNDRNEAIAKAEIAQEAFLASKNASDTDASNTSLVDLLKQKLSTEDFVLPHRRQVGGTHYLKQAIQPWELIEKNNLDFFQGNIIKYVMRWRDKGGLQDLRKAQHTLEHYIKIEEEVHANTERRMR